MRVRRLSLAAGIVGIASAIAACGGEAVKTQPTGTPRPATAVATRPVVTRPALTSAATVPTGASAPANPAATVPATALPPGKVLEPAPIDEAEMIVGESFPPQYAVRVVSGVPSGCHTFAGTSVSRNGAEITIAVSNSRPSDPAIACTQIYGMHEQIVQLGSDFQAGTPYRVTVNDRMIDFTAQ